jgi:hypothetical protein
MVTAIFVEVDVGLVRRRTIMLWASLGRFLNVSGNATSFVAATVKDIPRTKAAKVLILLFAGMSCAVIVALTEDSKTKIDEFGLLSVYMFLLSLYAAPQSKMSAFQLTASAIYSRMKTGEFKVGYLERLCSLLSVAFGIAAFIYVYKTYLV